ncbi:hypothetical protein QZH63_03185, partial [Eikenella corrodens]|nr:hypothetical protein [Eikenella corrodens]
MMPTPPLETLPYAGLPEWQHRQRCAAISRFHELGGVLDFRQFAYTTAAANEAERREYHLATASHHPRRCRQYGRCVGNVAPSRRMGGA